MLDRVRKPALDRRLVSFVAPRSLEAEQYRRLRNQLQAPATTRSLRVVAVTSPIAGDGKTLTVLNLAGAQAQLQSARVLVIDADLRRPSVARQLGLQRVDRGIAEILRSPDVWLHDVVQPVPHLNIDVLPCLEECEDAYELLASPRFAELVVKARALYDHVVLDTPPLVPVSDGTLIKSLIDGYIVVVSANSTPRRLVGEALSLLGPEAVVGIVFNRDLRPMFGRYDDYGSYFRRSRV